MLLLTGPLQRCLDRDLFQSVRPLAQQLRIGEVKAGQTLSCQPGSQNPALLVLDNKSFHECSFHLLAGARRFSIWLRWPASPNQTRYP
jgi:hypothetical protein